MQDSNINIIPYSPELAPYFKELNLAWIEHYFSLEKMDEVVLSFPEESVIAKGGFIFFAEIEGEIAGTFALYNVGDGVFELGKMAVAEKHRGKNIGNKMMEAALHFCKENEVKKIILFSNTVLQPAMHLYYKYGFVEVPLETSEYSRSNIKMEKDLTV